MNPCPLNWKCRVLTTGPPGKSYVCLTDKIIQILQQRANVLLWYLKPYSWPARRSNQSILKEISHGCSLEGLMLKLKLQYFGHLMQRADSFEKTLMLEKDWALEEKGTTEDEMIEWHHRLNGHEFEQTPWVGDGQGGLASCGSWGRKESQRVRQDWVTELTDSRPIFVKKKGVMVLNDIFDCKLLEFVTSSKFQAILT